MSFVGTVYVPPPQPSERARKLSTELQHTIEESKRRDPGLSDPDIRQALALATPSVAVARSTRLAIALAGVGLALIIGLFLASSRASSAPVPWGAVVAVVVGAAVAAMLYLRRRQ